MIVTDLRFLNGQSVLVKSTADHGDPPVAMRGTIEARADPSGKPVARIVLEFPDMCNRPAHREVIPLDTLAVEHLLASEHDGGYEYTIDGPLDPGPPPVL